MKTGFIVAGVLAVLAMPVVASAQDVIGGAQHGASKGARQGSKAAGPIGGVVGGAVGGAAGGVQGALGVPSTSKGKSKKKTQ